MTTENSTRGGSPSGLATCSDFLSIPLHDGTRLQIGDCFTVEDRYPFFSDGNENYNARLCWDDDEKTMWYDIYPISDRVRGCAVGGGVGKDEIEWSKIRRRPDPSQNANGDSR